MASGVYLKTCRVGNCDQFPGSGTRHSVTIANRGYHGDREEERLKPVPTVGFEFYADLVDVVGPHFGKNVSGNCLEEYDQFRRKLSKHIENGLISIGDSNKCKMRKSTILNFSSKKQFKMQRNSSEYESERKYLLVKRSR